MTSTSGSSGPPGSSTTIRETLELFRRLLGMYTLARTYAEACALVGGLDAGVPVPFLRGFKPWLESRRDEHTPLAFQEIVLKEAGVEGKGARSALTTSENEAAVATLFDLLATYLADNETAAR